MDIVKFCQNVVNGLNIALMTSQTEDTGDVFTYARGQAPRKMQAKTANVLGLASIGTMLLVFFLHSLKNETVMKILQNDRFKHFKISLSSTS